ncbi:HNH endonuclease family protein [Streptomyces sp. 8L]|uniref:HNH endonuclease family protein n=1 Tax=Streptomyces sp. 8L TaxID=2877242 RepID=UPI001CD64F39|nr:HNH endonuclease family protein [Streptomyces sp. 8L]MCA1222631.1 HNH endonuclease family protein [Streptomyces sp. 8L]
MSLRRLSTLVGAALLAASALTVAATPADAALPTPVTAATARSYLADLKVATENRTGYERSLFHTWITISGTCDTREYILKRDGTNVTTDASCKATAGTWKSVYDGATWTAASDLDIDHLVPLAEAWDSGASAWTAAQREAFANDVTRPQLLAVTDNVNQSKGDDDPAQWLPMASYQCTYVRAWVQVKHYYKLSVDTAEKAALTKVLGGC